ncbi:hypothetical protein E5678_18210 [Hydrogenophaga sp. PAMC20947]|nr:hypothetical protein E5678_18210 [Hydrogenophaga sp. PAMC20947]
MRAPTPRRVAGRCPPRGLGLGAARRRSRWFLAPHAPPRCGSLPPEGADPAWGGPAPDRLRAPTPRRVAGRCPPRALIRLGAARRRIACAPHFTANAPTSFTSALPEPPIHKARMNGLHGMFF